MHGCACAAQVVNGTLWLFTTSNATTNLPVAIVVSCTTFALHTHAAHAPA
jgi:hypothetical protein